MVWLVTAGTITVGEAIIGGAIIATGAVSARGQYVAGKQQEIAYEQQAEEEKLSAQAQEAARRQQLNKALSANIVGLATSGMSGEGTPQSLSIESAKQASISEGLEGLSSRLKQAQLKRQGKNAASMGGIQAASTLLNTTAQVAMLSGSRKKDT